MIGVHCRGDEARRLCGYINTFALIALGVSEMVCFDFERIPGIQCLSRHFS